MTTTPRSGYPRVRSSFVGQVNETMEAVGLAISVISLVGAFKDCIDLFSMISTAQSVEKDFTILRVKLDIEKTLLLQWATQVRLLQEDYDSRLDMPDTRRIIDRIL